MITAQDAQNLIVILNRSEFKGIQEAQVASVLYAKLDAIVKLAEAKQGEVEKEDKDGEDTPSAD